MLRLSLGGDVNDMTLLAFCQWLLVLCIRILYIYRDDGD